MNIIKIKDIVRPDDSEFNSKLKGQYAWWVHMRYIVSFLDMSVLEYVSVEEDPSELYNYKYWDSYDSQITEYIDVYETDKANSIIPYILHNENVIDGDLTLEDIKKFRTWLAKTLLDLDSISFIGDRRGPQPSYQLLGQNLTHTLQYYSKNMLDDTVKWLTEFTKASTNMETTYDDCGCNKSNIYGNIEVSYCDPVQVYRKGLYNNMVENFSNLDFWLQFKKEKWFFEKFKEYIDAIIKKDLLLGDTINSTVVCDCQTVDTQKVNINKLYKLSQSLQYIIDNEEDKHVNFINDSFKDWAENLYEIMQW